MLHVALLLMCMYSLTTPCPRHQRDLHSFPTRRSPICTPISWMSVRATARCWSAPAASRSSSMAGRTSPRWNAIDDDLLAARSEEHTSELQSHSDLVCRLLLEKKKN